MKTLRLNIFSGGMNTVLDPIFLEGTQAQILLDASVKSGKLIPIKQNLLNPNINLAAAGYWGNTQRSVVKWYNRYYWSNNYGTGNNYGGNEENFIGIDSPGLVNCAVSVGPGMTGTFRYAITFVTTNEHESSPVNATVWYKELTLSNQTVTITAPLVFPAHCKSINIYRTTNNSNTFYCVGTIDKTGGEFKDSVKDLDLVLRAPLSTLFHFPPPEGGRFLTEYAGVFYLAVNDRLYFSEPGEIHGWKPLNWISFENIITGIACEFSGVLVFTRNKTYRVTGANDIMTVTKTEIPAPQGCKNWRTISYMNNAPIWLSNDGICMWDGSNIQNVSLTAVDTSELTAAHAVVYNGCYFLFHALGCLCYDLRNGGIFYTSSDCCHDSWYDSNGDQLYLIIGDDVYSYASSDSFRTLHYRSAALAGSDCLLKIWNRVVVNTETQADIIFTISGKKPLKIQHSGGRKRYYMPYGEIGERITIDIQSCGIINEIVLEYQEAML